MPSVSLDGETSFHDPQYSHSHTSHLVSPYGSYQTTDYHMQNAMTPPSSVSPRDNHHNNTSSSAIPHSHHHHHASYLQEPVKSQYQSGEQSSPVVGVRCNRSL